VKAVCKPCWELKYCPYGPLVEDFPLKHPADPERSCRIFGHDCPVFSVAEPLTETREIRNVSRHIPRPIQFRVLKRDNQICAVCQRPVLDGDIHFDHIIPWSKGGPTEEHNIRLLCDRCNRKRGARFEDEHLVRSFADHVTPPIRLDFVRLILKFVADVHRWRATARRLPTGRDVAKLTGLRRSAFEDRMAELFKDLDQFFSSPPPREINGRIFSALRDRWGFNDPNRPLKLSTVAKAHEVDLNVLVGAEMDLVRRLGWPVVNTSSERLKWSRI
jgi:hypothetical protein